MANSFAGWVDGTRVVGRHELLFFYSLGECHRIHLGYVLADFTRFVIGTELVDRLYGQEVVGGTFSLGLDTL